MDAALPAPTIASALPTIPPRTVAAQVYDASFTVRSRSLTFSEYSDGRVGIWSAFDKGWVFEPGTVTTVQCASIVRTEKKHPTWAVVLGVIGLITTLIGGLLLFVTTTTQVPTHLVTVQAADGRWLRFQSDLAVAER